MYTIKEDDSNDEDVQEEKRVTVKRKQQQQKQQETVPAEEVYVSAEGMVLVTRLAAEQALGARKAKMHYRPQMLLNWLQSVAKGGCAFAASMGHVFFSPIPYLFLLVILPLPSCNAHM